MIRREGSNPEETMAAALEAYRAAAHAEADAHFDERALEAQRLRILQRIDHAGQPARVLRFPGAIAALKPSASFSRRWISAAAAAGLLVGIFTGQLLHVMPGDNWVHPTSSVSSPLTPVTQTPRMSLRPALATDTNDDALLGAIDLAVQYRGASDLRALDDLTFAYEPR